MRDVVVVGAGISGLTTAFWLTRAGLSVTVCEASSEIGGAIKTLREDRWLFEIGPNTVLESNPETADLIRDGGLAEERIEASPRAKKRFIWLGEELIPLPTAPLGLIKTPLIPLRAKLRLFLEPAIKAPPEEKEESIADFIRRRLGPALLDNAVAPFVSGIYAGDPERLSVRWALPRLAELERSHGSLFKGMMAKRREPKSQPSPMISFRRGLVSLPRKLAGELEDLRKGFAVRSLERRGGAFSVAGDGASIAGRQVVFSVPADAAARILGEITEGASAPLAKIPYAPVATLSLGFRREDLEHPLDGFGFLARRERGLRILGCLFPSSLYPDRAPEDHVALSVFAGGATDPEIVGWDDNRLLSVALEDLRAALGVRGAPVFERVTRWHRAIPQYEIGHGRFVERALEIERDHPGLHFASNFLEGISVPDCIAKATAVARHILAP